MEQIRQDIAVIKRDLEYITKFISDDRRKFDNHIKESDIYRKKVDGTASVKENLDSHIIGDRWMFGISFSLLIGIFAIVCKIAFKG